MFDLSKAIEFLEAGLGGTSAMAHQAPGLADLLSHAGIDASQLAGLAETDVLALLAEHGIDPAAIGEGQLTDFLASIPQASELTDQLGALQGIIPGNLRF